MLIAGIEAALGKSMSTEFLRRRAELAAPVGCGTSRRRPDFGRLRPDGLIMIEITLAASAPLRFARTWPGLSKQRQRLAMIAVQPSATASVWATKAEAIGLERAAQRQQHAVDAAAAAFGIGDHVGK